MEPNTCWVCASLDPTYRLLIREALKYIPAERLVLSSDCGMGREGMSRRHAFYKMVSLVQGTNIVRKELGLPVAESLGADPKFSLIREKK